MNAITARNKFTSKQPVNSGFRLEQHDRITIRGRSYDWAGKSGDTYFLQPSCGEGLTESFTIGQLSRLSAVGEVRHEVAYYLSSDLKPITGNKDLDFRISDLSPPEIKRFRAKYAQMRAIEDLVNEGQMQPSTKEIEANSTEISKRAGAYLAEVATERDLLKHAREHEKLPARTIGGTRRKRGGEETKGVSLYTADYLRKLFPKYQKIGLAALLDNLSNSGNRTSTFKPEEQILLMDTIRGSYLTPERKSLKTTVVDVQRAFRKENERRAEAGEGLLRVPGREAVRSAIKKIGALRVAIARYGREYAIKQLRPVGKGLEVQRPGQRVEIDEQCIDLQSIMYSAKLHKFFGRDSSKVSG